MEERRETKTMSIFVFLVVLYASITCTYAIDTIFANQAIRFGETIVSSKQTFELGFFYPGKSMNLYVGIWYKKIPNRTVVWVANRNEPLLDTSCELTLTLEGVLILRNTTTGNVVVWLSANSSKTTVTDPIGRLLDTGNFIIYEKPDGPDQADPIWQSFDFITDTLLPGMKHGRNLVNGIERHLTSWKSEDDPALGNYSDWIDTTRGYPQLMVKQGQVIKFRGGPWNGHRFTGIPNMKPNPYYNFTFVLNDREIYFQYNLTNTSEFMRVVIQPNGSFDRMLWLDKKKEWSVYLRPQIDQCDDYAWCGPFARCNIAHSPLCECLERFVPASPDQWNTGDWSQGCRHNHSLDCNPDEGFNRYSNLKLPDTQSNSWYDLTIPLTECEKMCKSNCSCTAYTNNISGTGSGCLLWFGNLSDIRTIPDGDTLYIRFSANELDSSAGTRVRVIVPIAFGVFVVILVSICLFYRLYKKKPQQEEVMVTHFTVRPGDESLHDPEYRSGDEDLELPLFGLSTLLQATNNFSINNKLGEGGFGPVYKGVLEDGQEIAVKRLAKTSDQGFHEFKNEVISICKLQHRNLVKLLGCCMHGAEKMLIYEYMPNKGLDSFIFDPIRSKLLDWSTRYHIINGIARGLLYLHQDSRLRIIHRDLKVSNILLDIDMNAKISDFGMARTFGGNQIEANTNRIVGTYGYMAPEYAGDGIFSTKSDVYSFGVLLLEIVSGEKNRGFIHKEKYYNLIGHAWGLHNKDRSFQFVAKCLLAESINMSQVLRSIHVGLLCVQRHPQDRPTMSSVILMLGSEGPLPSPKEPDCYVGKTKPDTTHSSSSYERSSNNGLSTSTLNGR